MDEGAFLSIGVQLFLTGPMLLQQNVDGDTIVFDVNSQQQQQLVYNAADCCAQCQKTSGCNTWTFCNSVEGCSEDCPANVAL